MNDELRKISQNAIAAINNPNTSAGTGDSVVNDFSRAAFQDVLNRGGQGIAPVANAAAAEEERAAEAARQAQIQALKDKLDPGNYKAAKDREDGGFSFYDPDGNQIGIDKYAAVTGVNPADILSESDNPFDLQYVNDYKNTRGLVEAVQNGDRDAIETYKSQNADVGKMTPEELMRQLIKKYPHIYGNGNYKDSYQNNNNPLLRMPTGTSGGGFSSGNNYGFE